MNLVRLLVLGNLAVISYFMLEKGVTTDFLPVLAFSIATSISSSPRVLGISLIIGSLDIPLLFFFPIPLVTLAFALSITALSLLSLKIEKAKFIVLPLSVVFFFFLGSFPLFLFFFGVLGSTLLLFDEIKDPRPLFTIAIPYFLTQLFFLFFFSLLSSSFSLLLFNEIGSYSKIVLPSIIIVFLVIFAGQFMENKNVLVSLASLILSVIVLFVYPQYALVYSSSSAIIINTIPSEKDIESLILKNIDNDKVLQDLLLEYKEDLTLFYCNLVNQGNCKAVVKIPSAVPYKINYALCDINKIAECFEKMKQVPPIDIVNFLSIVKNKDLELAERIGELARQVAPSPRLLSMLDEIQILKMENLKQNWDPKVWLNREIFGYRITDYLGKGGSSYVLVGEKQGKKYAIKIPILFPPSTATDSYYDFINEYSQLRELSSLSDNIVKFVDSRIDVQSIRKIVKEGDVLSYLNEPPLLVMEYMEGGSSKDLIYNDNVFYSDEWKKIVLLIGLKVSEALMEIHKAGFVHLDIKPSNILFSHPPGKTGKDVWSNLNSHVKVKISDLGSARKVGEKISQYTPEYCSIDQIEAIVEGKGADPSMDIYSLGATLYKMLTRKDYNPPDVVRIINEIPIILEQKGDAKVMIDKAKEIYLKYYEELVIPDVEKDIHDLIKSITSPKARPTAEEVYNRLKQLLNKYERSNSP